MVAWIWAVVCAYKSRRRPAKNRNHKSGRRVRVGHLGLKLRDSGPHLLKRPARVAIWKSTLAGAHWTWLGHRVGRGIWLRGGIGSRGVTALDVGAVIVAGDQQKRMYVSSGIQGCAGNLTAIVDRLRVSQGQSGICGNQSIQIKERAIIVQNRANNARVTVTI